MEFIVKNRQQLNRQWSPFKWNKCFCFCLCVGESFDFVFDSKWVGGVRLSADQGL